MEVETSGLHFRKMMQAFHDREVLLVLEEESLLQGWGVVKRYSDRPGYRVACETSIYLRQSSTGRGLGSRLQQALMEKAKEFGYHHIVTKIWASNDGSLRFHERFGFEIIGIQKEVGYMDGQWRDVAIMQCVFPDVEPYRPDLA